MVHRVPLAIHSWLISVCRPPCLNSLGRIKRGQRRPWNPQTGHKLLNRLRSVKKPSELWKRNCPRLQYLAILTTICHSSSRLMHHWRVWEPFSGRSKRGRRECSLTLPAACPQQREGIPPTSWSFSFKVADKFKEYICHYGIPERIHADQGRSLESNLIRQLCKVMGLARNRTMLYHPQLNGSTVPSWICCAHWTQSKRWIWRIMSRH